MIYETFIFHYDRIMMSHGPHLGVLLSYLMRIKKFKSGEMSH